MIGVAADGKTTEPSVLGAADVNGDRITDLFYTGGHLLPAIGVATATGTGFNTNLTVYAGHLDRESY